MTDILQTLIRSLAEYKSMFPMEIGRVDRIELLINTCVGKAFHNYHWDDGHITASMLITNPERSKVLLMLHKKLGRWLQFGGHSDDSPDTLSTAMREFHEESGITDEPEIFSYFDKDFLPIFDIDIHTIPADLKGRPEHLHYDIRFLGVIDENSEIIRQEDEVDDIKWFLLEDIEKIISEVGTLRMMAKLKQLP